MSDFRAEFLTFAPGPLVPRETFAQNVARNSVQNLRAKFRAKFRAKLSREIPRETFARNFRAKFRAKIGHFATGHFTDRAKSDTLAPSPGHSGARHSQRVSGAVRAAKELQGLLMLAEEWRLNGGMAL